MNLWTPHESKKPQRGQARLNYSNPLVRGMVGCWLFNENGGRAFNLAGDYGHAYYQEGSVAHKAGPEGIGLRFTDTDSERYVIPEHASMWPTTGVSIATYCTIFAIPASGDYTLYFGSDSSDRQLEFSYGWADSHPTSILEIESTRRDYTANNPPDVVDTTVGTHHYGFTWTGTTGVGTFYWDHAIASWSFTHTGSLTHTASDHMIGALGGSEGWGPGQVIYYRTVLWNRCLSAEEMMAVYAEPYGFLEPVFPARKYFVISGASAPEMSTWWKQSSDPRRTSAEVVTY